MQDQRHQDGLKLLERLYGESAGVFLESLSQIAPSVAGYSVDFVFGDIYSRATLDLKQRQLLTVAVLAALGGCEPQLKVHIGAALNLGLSPNEIVETIIHCIPFVGFPRSLNAIAAARSIFEDRKVRPEW
ncbi:MAG: carboxymuconolactone decarboxylase family protein [Negativicutes bacterium]|nr:carboxymuconolactone decarboxylase family protein [Negativicutes bacterium]